MSQLDGILVSHWGRSAYLMNAVGLIAPKGDSLSLASDYHVSTFSFLFLGITVCSEILEPVALTLTTRPSMNLSFKKPRRDKGASVGGPQM